MKTIYPDYIIWRIDETEEELLASLQHHEYFAEKIARLKPGSRRKLEVLAVRRALKELCMGEEQLVDYDDDGKPVLSQSFVNEEGEVFDYISISHTDGYAAVSLCQQPVGIDIERRGTRVQRVVNLFLKPEEISLLMLSGNEELALHMAWSAKEAAYKILGKPYYDLQKLTTVSFIDLVSDVPLLKLQVEGKSEPLTVRFSLHEDYVFAYVVCAG